MRSGPVDPIDRERVRYLEAVSEASGGEDRMIVMAAVAQALGRVAEWPVPRALALHAIDVSGSSAGRAVAAIDPPQDSADAWLLGEVHEALLDAGERQAAGAHYTSREIAAGLIRWATAGSDLPSGALICDPAVGGGVFLLAAADLLLDRGGDPAEIVRRSLWGIELDPVAVAVTDAALSHWSWRAGADPALSAGPHLVRADALVVGASAWPASMGQGVPAFDLVIGNPPFQSQLGRATARSPADAAVLRAKLGDSVTGYADSATLFLLAASRMVRPGGRVALVQPMSMFGARDSARARSEMLAGARLDGVWTAGAPVFSAQVRVGAVVLEADPALDGGAAGAPDEPLPVRRASGPAFASDPEVAVGRSDLRSAVSWSHLVAASDTPAVDRASTAGQLGAIASATAGFRDEYYGLIPFVREASGASGDEEAPLVTSGLIDPACSRWGDAPCRFAGRRWARPSVDVRSARTSDERLDRWLGRVLVPKVLVACQTRVIEAVVDPAGALVPSVPVIAVCAHADRLFDVAAVLLSPWASAWAVRLAAGSALSADAIKLAAKQVLDVPLPADSDAWAQGADHLRDAGVGLGDAAAFAAIMNRAYGLVSDTDLTAWWLARLPVRT